MAFLRFVLYFGIEFFFLIAIKSGCANPVEDIATLRSVRRYSWEQCRTCISACVFLHFLFSRYYFGVKNQAPLTKGSCGSEVSQKFPFLQILESLNSNKPYIF